MSDGKDKGDRLTQNQRQTRDEYAERAEVREATKTSDSASVDDGAVQCHGDGEDDEDPAARTGAIETG